MSVEPTNPSTSAPAEASAPALPADAEAPTTELPGEWAQELPRELPPRSRRRLLGPGANPVALALIGVLLLACGFVGGVLVEKGETEGSPAAGGGSGVSGLATRLGALGSGAGGAGAKNGAAGGAGANSGAGGGPSAGASPSAGGGPSARLGALGGGATIGEVSYISGSTLYVTNFEGATVKVNASPAASITKTVKADLHGIHPGETVVVRGARGANGAVSAESISVGAADGVGGALGALFARGSARGGGPGGGEGSAGGGAALFGK